MLSALAGAAAARQTASPPIPNEEALRVMPPETAAFLERFDEKARLKRVADMEAGRLLLPEVMRQRLGISRQALAQAVREHRMSHWTGLVGRTSTQRSLPTAATSARNLRKYRAPWATYLAMSNGIFSQANFSLSNRAFRSMFWPEVGDSTRFSRPPPCSLSSENGYFRSQGVASMPADGKIIWRSIVQRPVRPTAAKSPGTDWAPHATFE